VIADANHRRRTTVTDDNFPLFVVEFHRHAWEEIDQCLQPHSRELHHSSIRASFPALPSLAIASQIAFPAAGLRARNWPSVPLVTALADTAYFCNDL